MSGDESPWLQKLRNVPGLSQTQFIAAKVLLTFMADACRNDILSGDEDEQQATILALLQGAVTPGPAVTSSAAPSTVPMAISAARTGGIGDNTAASGAMAAGPAVTSSAAPATVPMAVSDNGAMVELSNKIDDLARAVHDDRASMGRKVDDLALSILKSGPGGYGYEQETNGQRLSRWWKENVLSASGAPFFC